MQVLVVADSFPPAPGPADVARAVAAGWSAGAPHDVVAALGLSSGGRGVVALLAGALGTPALRDGLLVVDSAPGSRTGSRTAYVEAPDEAHGTSRGLGARVQRALDLGVTRVVVGLDAACGPGQVPDGGAGLLLALAAAGGSGTAAAMLAELKRSTAERGALTAVLSALDAPASRWDEVLTAARARLGGTDLVGAVATDIPLLGMHGASAGAARDGRLTDALAQDLERALGAFAHAAAASIPAGPRLLPLAGSPDRPASARYVASTAGAGAGGGVGFALAALGGRLLPGAGVVAAAVGLAGLVAASDLLVAARGELDGATFDSTVVGEAVRTAGAEGVPCLVVAGSSLMSRREYSAHGISALHVLGDDRDRPRATTSDAVLGELHDRAARLARSWSPARLAASDG